MTQQTATKRPPVLGILGGIGSGKSTVSSALVEFGAGVIDADRVAKEVMETDSIRGAIAQSLGSQARNKDGSLDREWIAKRVFANEAARKKLNQIVHPRVRERIEETLRQWGVDDPQSERPSENHDHPSEGPPLVVLDVPLLLESDLNRYVDFYLFVDTPLEERENRVRATRGWTTEELQAREATQTSLEVKRQKSAFVIDNGSNVETTKESVRDLWPKIMDRARTIQTPPPSDHRTVKKELRRRSN